MKRLLQSFVLILLSAANHAQDIAGTWEGKMTMRYPKDPWEITVKLYLVKDRSLSDTSTKYFALFKSYIGHAERVIYRNLADAWFNSQTNQFRYTSISYYSKPDKESYNDPCSRYWVQQGRFNVN